MESLHRRRLKRCCVVCDNRVRSSAIRGVLLEYQAELRCDATDARLIGYFGKLCRLPIHNTQHTKRLTSSRNETMTFRRCRECEKTRERWYPIEKRVSGRGYFVVCSVKEKQEGNAWEGNDLVGHDLRLERSKGRHKHSLALLKCGRFGCHAKEDQPSAHHSCYGRSWQR